MTESAFEGEPGAMPCSGDACFCRQGIAVHPPVLMVFDPARGEYVAATNERCTARWASTGDGHLAGQICGRAGPHEVGGAPLCGHHYKRACQWAREYGAEDTAAIQARLEEWHREEMRLERERYQQMDELDRERIHAQERAWAEYSHVYYIRRASDGMIKIGTSRTLAVRLARLRNDHGPLVLMAVHGGTHVEENRIHGQFDNLRESSRTEWFLPELSLLEHIMQVRDRAEIPDLAGLPPVLDYAELRRIVRRRRRERKAAQAA